MRRDSYVKGPSEGVEVERTVRANVLGHQEAWDLQECSVKA